MSNNLFTPKVYQAAFRQEADDGKDPTLDTAGRFILKLKQYLVIGFIFLIPTFFIPGLPTSLVFDKAMLAAVIGLSVLVLSGLSALRYTNVSTVIPAPLVAFWTFILCAFVSALLSGDIQDALRGSFFESHTVGFLALLGLTMTIPLVLQGSKKTNFKALLALVAGISLVLVYTLSRLLLGADFLSLDSFATVTTSPAGEFNDLAILAALLVILSLMTLLQQSLKRTSEFIIAGLVTLALILLAVVNFFHIWIVVGFFGLLLLVYIFARDTLFARLDNGERSPISPVVIATTLVVCVVSSMFVVAGDYFGSTVSDATGVNYLEVRPSLAATIDITRDVYREDVLLGTGPNRFADAWRLYKEKSINETLFWNTDFNAGFGFIPTLFITLGALGGFAIIVFHALYIYLGYRMFLRSDSNDSFWYYFGLMTFTSAVFLWGMSYVYVSGPVILLLASILTGLSFVAYQALVPAAIIRIPLVSSRRRGFFLMSVVIIVITLSVGSLFTMGKQYVAQAEFAQAQNVSDIETFQRRIESAYAQYQDDTFALALAQSNLVQLEQMFAIESPTTADQERFAALAVQARQQAEVAVALDPTNPNGYTVLANLFSILAAAGFEGAEQIAFGRLEDAAWRNPLSPTYPMIGAYLAVRLGNTELAREKIAEALSLKSNFGEALLLLSQLEVREGNVTSAIDTTRRIISLEPNNPTRYYQLGVLLAAREEFEAAAEAYKAAIAIDQNFANARYMLALVYLDLGRLDEALIELRIVRETNSDNQDLQNLITQLETQGLPTATPSDLETPITDSAPTRGIGENVTSPTVPDTSLVSPVNTAPATTEDVEPVE